MANKSITVEDIRTIYNFRNISNCDAEKLIIFLRKVCNTVVDGIIDDKYES